MSQHWHGHWTNDAFEPVRLRNWEVPNWHPCWPDRHCRTTQFMADNNGRILVGQKRSKQSPWGYFKGTWDLPKKISRKEAYELSTPPKYKTNAWAEHKRINEAICKTKNTVTTVERKKNQHPTTGKPEGTHQDQDSQRSNTKLPLHTSCITDTSPKTSCPIHNTCQI